MPEKQLEVRRLGRFSYDAGLRLQKELEQEVIERRETDYLLLLEHPHTFTIGRRAKENRRFGDRRDAQKFRSFGL